MSFSRLEQPHEQPSPARCHRHRRRPHPVLRAQQDRGHDAPIQVRCPGAVRPRDPAARLCRPLGDRQPGTELQPHTLHSLRADDVGDRAAVQRGHSAGKEGHCPVTVTGLCPF